MDKSQMSSLLPYAPIICTDPTKVDPSLTEINIDKLASQVGNYQGITDEEIEHCLNFKVFFATECIYNGNGVNKYINAEKMYHILRTATIVNEIQKGTYNYNYTIPILNAADGDDDPYYIVDNIGLHQIRAFQYCKKNIFMSVFRED